MSSFDLRTTFTSGFTKAWLGNGSRGTIAYSGLNKSRFARQHSLHNGEGFLLLETSPVIPSSLGMTTLSREESNIRSNRVWPESNDSISNRFSCSSSWQNDDATLRSFHLGQSSITFWQFVAVRLSNILLYLCLAEHISPPLGGTSQVTTGQETAIEVVLFPNWPVISESKRANCLVPCKNQHLYSFIVRRLEIYFLYLRDEEII